MALWQLFNVFGALVMLNTKPCCVERTSLKTTLVSWVGNILESRGYGSFCRGLLTLFMVILWTVTGKKIVNCFQKFRFFVWMSVLVSQASLRIFMRDGAIVFRRWKKNKFRVTFWVNIWCLIFILFWQVAFECDYEYIKSLLGFSWHFKNHFRVQEHVLPGAKLDFRILGYQFRAHWRAMSTSWPKATHSGQWCLEVVSDLEIGIHVMITCLKIQSRIFMLVRFLFSRSRAGLEILGARGETKI